MKKNDDPRNQKYDVPRAVQARLQREGLLAEPHERWTHPSGAFSLDALPTLMPAKRRQRSDRPKKHEIELNKLTRDEKRKEWYREHGKRAA